ncbi:MAG: hypothetical protein ACU841_08135 [Gammaproteobacteria bacterium]
MTQLKRNRWLISFFLSGIAVGIPYWRIPYHEVSLPDTLMAPGLLVVAMTSLWLGLRGAPFGKTVKIMALPVPAAVFVRIAVETAKDPTSHNLWPFEIIMALLLGIACSLSGALSARLYSMLKGSGTGSGKS